MEGKDAVQIVQTERKFLTNGIKQFKPEHGDFKPQDGMRTVTQLIRHIAWSVNWFREGAFGSGFSMNFEQEESELSKPFPFEDAVAELNEAYDDWIVTLETKTSEELTSPLDENPVFGPAPKLVCISANADHTAHHRGALMVYLRLLGETPKMIYED